MGARMAVMTQPEVAFPASDAWRRYVDSLTPEQRAAATAIASVTRVIAGAGTGKTRVLAARVAALVGSGAVPAAEIVVVTFTRKAAGELRRRLDALFPAETLRGLTVTTFHALGLQLLRTEGGRLGLSTRATVLDPVDARRMMKHVLEAGHLPATGRAVDDLSARIEAGRSAVTTELCASATPGETSVRGLSVWRRLAGFGATADDPYHRYHAALERDKVLDFGLLEHAALALLATEPELCASLRHQWRHWIVDEFQDVNTTQFRLLQLLVGRSGILTVVGDDAQAIYGWRGARPDLLRQLEREYPDVETITLTTNFRSAPKIIEAANAVSRRTTALPRTLESVREELFPVLVLDTPSPAVEAQEIARRLAVWREQGLIASWRDVLILYRRHELVAAVEYALRTRGIPCRVLGGLTHFERPEVRALLGVLRLAINPRDGAALVPAIDVFATPPSTGTIDTVISAANAAGIGVLEAARATASAQLTSPAQRVRLTRAVEVLEAAVPRVQRHPAAGLRWLLSESGLRNRCVDAVPDADPSLHPEMDARELAALVWRRQDRVEALDTVVAWADEIGGGPLNVLDACVERSMDDDALPDDGRLDVVRCMSVHAAKGLEAPVVAVVGCNEQHFPARRRDLEALRADLTDPEELRLFYVAVTRAQVRLILTAARARSKPGTRSAPVSTPPSRFLSFLPDWAYMSVRV